MSARLLNSNPILTNLSNQELSYLQSASATRDQREFNVGICDSNFNGQRVMHLSQKIHITHFFFGPAYPKHTFEGELSNSTIIGWRIACTRPFEDNNGGEWKRINRTIGTSHYKFLVTSCFMRDLDWEIDIYYI